MKFEIEPLVAEMLDQLPESVWASDSTTFFDPAIGGGQFIRAIEQRLRNHGHSDKNIRTRVFGLENSELHIRYAVNKHKLVGQYVKKPYEKFFELDNTMKFDVVVGNPPYQGNNDKGTKQPKSHNLWSKFAEQGINLVKENGYVAFVTPDSWMSPNSQVLKTFKENSLTWVSTNVSRYFSVGSSFTAWILQKNQNTKTVSIDGLTVNLNTLNYLPRDFSKTYPIHDKVINSNHTKLAALCDTTCHSDHKHGKLSDTQDAVFKYKTWHTNAQTRFSKVKSKDFDKHKIIWTLSGYFKPFYDDGNFGTTEVCQYILVADQTEANQILSYLNSKLYNFLITTGKWSGFLNGKLLCSLPKLSNKIWSDKQIYKHFGLTQEEIDYVEANVK
jgi:site-specific DNA-methyltransferase (adenine-specific)